MSGVIIKQNILIHSPSHSDTLILIKNSNTPSALLCFLNALNKTEKKANLAVTPENWYHYTNGTRSIVLCRQVFSISSYTTAVTQIPECQGHKNNDNIHSALSGTHLLFISFLTASIALPPKGSSPVPFPMNINHLGMQKKPPLL